MPFLPDFVSYRLSLASAFTLARLAIDAAPNR